MNNQDLWFVWENILHSKFYVVHNWQKIINLKDTKKISRFLKSLLWSEAGYLLQLSSKAKPNFLHFPSFIYSREQVTTRVELIIKKFNFVWHEKTKATIYRIKTELLIPFNFWQLHTCADLTIFGVKVTVTTIDPNFSTSQVFIIYQIKSKVYDLWMHPLTNVVHKDIFGG